MEAPHPTAVISDASARSKKRLGSYCHNQTSILAALNERLWVECCRLAFLSDVQRVPTKVGRSSAMLEVSAYVDIGRSAPIKPFGQGRLQSRTSMGQMRSLKATFRPYGQNSVDAAELAAAPAGHILTSRHRSLPTTMPPPNRKVGHCGHGVARACRDLSLVRIYCD